MTTHGQDSPARQPTRPGDTSAGQQASDAAQAGKQAAGDVASTAADAAKDVVHETGAQARDLASKTRGELREQASAQQVTVVENLRSLAEQLDEMTDHVEQQGTAVDLAVGARDRVRRAADWLDGRDPGDLLDELRRVGRNKPAGFLLGSLIAGVAAGRLTRGVVAEHTGDSDTAAKKATDASSPGSAPGRTTTTDRAPLRASGTPSERTPASLVTAGRVTERMRRCRDDGGP